MWCRVGSITYSCDTEEYSKKFIREVYEIVILWVKGRKVGLKMNVVSQYTYLHVSAFTYT